MKIYELIDSRSNKSIQEKASSLYVKPKLVVVYTGNKFNINEKPAQVSDFFDKDFNIKKVVKPVLFKYHINSNEYNMVQKIVKRYHKSLTK